jgi:hypothetical protein
VREDWQFEEEEEKGSRRKKGDWRERKEREGRS